MSDQKLEKSNVPEIDLWAEDGCISLVIRKAKVIEYKEELTPGLCLSPMGAISLAEALLAKAKEAMEQ